jgi:hypothetical protein
MPTYTFVVEVLQTRAYQVLADHRIAAEELVRDEFEAMPYDVLEATLDSLELTDAD